MLLSPLEEKDLAHCKRALMDELERRIPAGLGRGGIWSLHSDRQLDRVLTEGSAFSVSAGYGVPDDLERCEDRGVVADAELSRVSEDARRRGLHQVGSLGSGNHFLEVQVVDSIYDPTTADCFGLHEDQVCVMIHSGSRGLGHQICSDHVRIMLGAMERYGIAVPDRQLACTPVDSPEGHAYLGAMAAGANYGRANRQVLTAATREAFLSATGNGDLRLLYDISHNLAKLERHPVGGSNRLLCVHRKGATRALPPGHEELPAGLRATGQPVLVPGSMGTASHVLVGADSGDAFHSTCHGAGRTMSRHAAVRRVKGSQLREELGQAGISVRARSERGLAEEAPFAYKDVDEVVAVCEEAGLARRVARMRPIGVVKG